MQRTRTAGVLAGGQAGGSPEASLTERVGEVAALAGRAQVLRLPRNLKASDAYLERMQAAASCRMATRNRIALETGGKPRMRRRG